MKTNSPEPCGLGTSESRSSPKNIEVALAIEIHDISRVLFTLGHHSPQIFEEGLERLNVTITSYFELKGKL